MKKGFLLLFVWLCLGSLITVVAQPMYTVDISRQQYTSTRTGFIKTGTNVSSEGETLSYNNLYLTKNGQPWYPIMGELHISRTHEKDWEESILKMKAAGIEIISSYLFWNYVEGQEGQFDWTGSNNLRKFLALCKKYKMYVWLRVGPWIHAEARNGGFPDWLMSKGIGLRKDDSGYLAYAAKWFYQVAMQCDGNYYKQNGTIIGIQLENEMEFKKPQDYQHMKSLKHLAIAAGMDVPFYSAFAQGPDTQDEFLYTMGGYPDSPWAQHTQRMYKPVFYIKPLEADTDIGSDLFGKVDATVRNTYPKLSAELGSGMQKTYHRRVDVSPTDIGANVFTRIASGLNGLGYFMFHGGLNAAGKNLQESRVSGYPNDLPYVDYDFQAPIGAMGIIRPSYNELRMINMFIHDFGDSLCTQNAFFPSKRVKSPFSYDTVQVSVRANNNSGFIFLSNYQRFIDLPSVNKFQLHLITTSGEVRIPERPVTIAANSYMLWPYNLSIGDAILNYATAQPLCILRNKTEDSYVFFSAGSTATFVLDKATVSSCRAVDGSSVSTTSNKIYVHCTTGKKGVAEIVTGAGKKIRLILLSRDQALKAVKVTINNKQLLLMSDANLLPDGDQLIVEQTGNEAAVVDIYPGNALQAITPSAILQKMTSDFPFDRYRVKAVRAETARVSSIENTKRMVTNNDSADALQFRDSIQAYYAQSKKFNKRQPGPLYQYTFHNLPFQRVYDLSILRPQKTSVKDWIATFNYHGDALAFYRNDSLVYDQFNYNDTCSIRLSYFLQKPVEHLSLQLLPMDKEYDIYVEDQFRKKREREWTTAQLNSLSLSPVYWFRLRIQ